MSNSHAKLSASGSAKWLTCPGSLALESKLPEEEDSVHSKEGSAAHFLGEYCLKNKIAPSALRNKWVVLDETDGDHIEVQPKTQSIDTWKIKDDMIEAVEVYVEYIERLQAKNTFIEERVDYTHIAPKGFGTADFVGEVYEKVSHESKVNSLYVVDYKHGKGVRVDAFENSQGMLYGLGALNSLDMFFDREIERVVIVIVQPRMDNISEFEISVKDLEAWGQSIKPKAKKAWELLQQTIKGEDVSLDEGCFNPTEKGCRWCKGKRLKKCKALAQAGFDSAIDGFDNMTTEERADLPKVQVSNSTTKDPMLMDNADLAACFKGIKTFMSFASELDEEIRSRLNDGEVVPGLKLIPSEGNRAWLGDDKDAIKAMRTAGLKKENYERISIISPAQAQKELKKEKPKDHVKRFKKLELQAVYRLGGKGKIVEDNGQHDDDFDDLLD